MGGNENIAMSETKLTELEDALLGLLQLSNAGRAAELVLMIRFATASENQQLEMCEYLLENEDATEGQILWKCRQILGRE